MWRACCLLFFTSVVCGSGCGDDEPLLFIELRTDLVPGVEFVSVQTSVAEPDRSSTVAAGVSQDYLSGERVAELGGLPVGSRVVRVALLDAADTVVAERTARIEFSKTVGVTILITRDCREVSCGSGMTCVGGACASVDCLEELRPEACGVRECASAVNCASPPSSCATLLCDLGSCLYAEDEAACSTGQYCDVDLGCRDLPTPMDAGARDASVADGGSEDAGDAGGPEIDAGPTFGTSVSAATFHTCTTRPDGHASCWGLATGGQLGEGSPTGVATSARAVSSLSDVIDLSTGPFHTCALRATGELACWGNNGSGQLGDTTTSGATTPTAVSGLADVSVVETGRDFTCAVTSSGAVHCWGLNDWGQLGDRTSMNRSAPTLVPDIDDAVGLATSQNGTCVRRAAGVTCFGLGYFGDGVQTNDPADRATPPLPGLQDLVMGANHFCALLPDGEVRCWGDNGFGQVGVGPGLSTSPQVVPVAASRQIWAGEARTCVRTTADQMFCWGRNERGQLGDETMNDALTPTRVLALEVADDLSLGDGHTCFTRSAQVFCLGWNDSGQLGDGTMMSRLMPSMVILD